MLYIVLVMIIILIAIPFIFQTIQIKKISGQLKKQQMIRITLNSRRIEELADCINHSMKNQKNLQLDIKRREERLKQSIADISHDLRTPLTSIQGYLTLLRDCNEEEKERYLNIIEVKANSLNVLVNDFYDLSILEDENFRINTKPVDIVSIITDVIISNYPLFNEKNIVPELNIPHEQIVVVGENSACQRIIQNLISNAIRYSSETVAIRLEQSINGCIFTISNSVIEIDERELPYMFDRFYMADKSRNKGGTGLGLYIVKTLLEKIEGRVLDVSLIDQIIHISIEFKKYEY